MSQEELASPARRAFFRRFALKEEPVEIPESNYPRPPWARDNQSFLALCDNCDRCINACPERIIERSNENNPVLSGKPILNLAYGHCTFCGQCTDACSSGALYKATNATSIRAIPQLVQRCQTTFGMFCDLCSEACNEAAIQADGSSAPVIDNDKCTGCGACALNCYTKALIMQPAKGNHTL